MKSLLIRLYPARWRARYGDEFLAILEERPLGPFDVADILLGALDAQTHLRGRGAGAERSQGRRFTLSLRIGGIAAIIGGVLWPVGFFLTAGAGDRGASDPIAEAVLLVIGSLALVVALAGLSAFQARTHPGLAWAAFAIPAVGTIVSIVGIIGILSGGDYWVVWGLGTLTAFVGSTLFAVVTYRTAALSRRASALLGVGSVTTIVALAGTVDLGPALIVAALGCFGVGWFALGVQAIRVDRPSTEPRPA